MHQHTLTTANAASQQLNAERTGDAQAIEVARLRTAWVAAADLCQPGAPSLDALRADRDEKYQAYCRAAFNANYDSQRTSLAAMARR